MSTSQKRNYLSILMATLVFIAVGTRYADYVWARNSLLYIYAPCDPNTESCFLAYEEFAWTEVQLQPYKKVEIKQRLAPNCLEEHTCENFSCHGITDCMETTCTETSLEEGEYCVDAELIDSELEN